MTAAVMHACPGGCGAQVPSHQLACRGCWYRLPAGYRAAVTHTHRRRGIDPSGHRAAVLGAVAWYRSHPPGPGELR